MFERFDGYRLSYVELYDGCRVSHVVGPRDSVLRIAGRLTYLLNKQGSNIPGDCMAQRYHVTLKHLQVAGLLLNGYQCQMLILSATLLHQALLRDCGQAFPFSLLLYTQTPSSAGPSARHPARFPSGIVRSAGTASNLSVAFIEQRSVANGIIMLPTPAREEDCLLIWQRRCLTAVLRLP